MKVAENQMNLLDFQSTKTKVSQTSSTDFGKAMQTATANNDSAQPTKTTQTQQKSQTEKETDVKNAVEEMQNNSTQKEVTSIDNKEEFNEEDFIAVMETLVGTVKQQLMDLFDISEKQLNFVMETLDITDESLLDQDVLKSLVMELSGVEDEMGLLFQDGVAEFLTSVQKSLDELPKEVGIDNAVQLYQQKVTEQKETSPMEVVEEENVVNQVKSSTESVDSAELPDGQEEIVQVQTTDTKEDVSSDKSKSDNHLNNEQESLSSQIFSKIETIVEEQIPEVDAKEVVRQVIDEIKLTVKADTSSFEMQLNPEHLGKVNLQVAAKNGVVTAQLSTETLAAKEMLEGQIAVLKETLNNQGVKVEAVEVTVATRSFDQNLDGQSDNQNQENGQKRSRRFRFDVMEAEEEELNSAEMIAREIMMANGNRIDYNA